MLLTLVRAVCVHGDGEDGPAAVFNEQPCLAHGETCSAMLAQQFFCQRWG